MEPSDVFERESSVLLLTRPSTGDAEYDGPTDYLVDTRTTSYRRPRRSRIVAAVLIAFAVVAGVAVVTGQFDGGGSDIIAGPDESPTEETTPTTGPEVERAEADETEDVSPTTTTTSLATTTPIGGDESEPETPDVATETETDAEGEVEPAPADSQPASTTSTTGRPGVPTLAERGSADATSEATTQSSNGQATTTRRATTTSGQASTTSQRATTSTRRATTTSALATTTTQRATTSSQRATTSTQRATTTSRQTTTTRPATTTTTAPVPPSGRTSTDAVVGQLPAGAVRFFSNNDGCGGLGQGQPHADWLQGQSTSGNNSDGTPTYGFAYNTGDSTRGQITWGFLPRPEALSGDCVLSMGLNGAYDSTRAIRIFRRYDQNGNHLPADAYYSAWFYFPTEVSFDKTGVVDGRNNTGFWNVFQLKNKVREPNGNLASLANLSVNAGKASGESHMSFRIWRKSQCGEVEECGAAAFIDQVVDLPIPTGRWVHLELRVRSRTDNSGRVQMWQDGTKIADFTGVTERPNTERREWSVNNYGRLHRPSNHVLYVDDALISTQAVHPLLFG